MSFLALALALLIDTFTAWRVNVQRDGVFLTELQRLQRGNSRATSSMALVLIPAVLLALLLHVLQPVAYGLLVLPVHVLVLLYSLGRNDPRAALGAFRDAWRRDDPATAARVAERDLGLTADDPDGLLARVQSNLLWEAYQGFFAVVFWYCLLGPAGALAYRLLALSTTHAQTPAAKAQSLRCRYWADWLPVRVMATSFALVGNFVTVSRLMLVEVLNPQVSAAQLIAKAGDAADHGAAHGPAATPLARLDRLWELLVRCTVLWFTLLAVWTVMG